MFPDRHPNTWLKHPATIRFMREPASGDKLVSTIDGKVTNFSMSGERGCQLTIVTEDEETEKQTLTTAACGYAPGESSDVATIRAIGLRPQQYIFPKNFDPTFYLAELEGQYARIQRYRDASEKEYLQVWIF
jgi:hypothetical protein